MRLPAWILVALAAGPTIAAEPAQPNDVTLRPVGYGWVLADARGMTLYTYAQDPKSGSPTCVAKCLETWPPLTAQAGAASTGEWSVIVREDGSRQWAYRGKPLYRFVRDSAPGDMNGDELQQKWYVAVKPIVAPPGFSVLKTPGGHVLIDGKRMTLYQSSADRSGHSNCDAACLRSWRPVEGWWMAVPPSADWSLAARADGMRQWAFRGRPLYRHAADSTPGEALGVGVGTFAAVVLEPPPANPAWVTRQQSDGGELFADAAGQTLYGHDPGGYHLGRVIEHPEWWRPVLAAVDARPVGAWSIVAREDGSRQWAHKGLRLYTNRRDREPGDINGVRSGDRIWRPIMTSGQTMPGSGL